MKRFRAYLICVFCVATIVACDRKIVKYTNDDNVPNAAHLIETSKSKLRADRVPSNASIIIKRDKTYGLIIVRFDWTQPGVRKTSNDWVEVIYHEDGRQFKAVHFPQG